MLRETELLLSAGSILLIPVTAFTLLLRINLNIIIPPVNYSIKAYISRLDIERTDKHSYSLSILIQSLQMLYHYIYKVKWMRIKNVSYHFCIENSAVYILYLSHLHLQMNYPPVTVFNILSTEFSTYSRKKYRDDSKKKMEKPLI